MANVRLSISVDPRDLPVLDGTVKAYAGSRGIATADAARVADVAMKLAGWLRENAYSSESAGDIVVDLDVVDGGVSCILRDQGRPLGSFGGTFGSVPPELAAITQDVTDLRLINLGVEGKRLTAVVPVEGLVLDARDHSSTDAAPKAAVEVTSADIVIRDAEPADAQAIATLLYETYGLGYAHVDFLQPDWIAESIASGLFYSSVAVFDTEVIGHHAMLIEHAGGAVESGVAVVHSAFRGLGIVSLLADHSIQRVRAAGVPAVLSRAVTNHPYSQRAERSLGFHTTALMLGSARPANGRRVALLAAYLCFEAETRAVSLPEFYSEPLIAAYENVGLPWVWSERMRNRDRVAVDRAIVVERDGPTSIKGSSVITVGRWSEDIRPDMINVLRDAVRGDDEMVYCDLDLHALSVSELDELVELLRNYDFFYAGLMLYGRNGHDFLRLQAMLTHDVEVDGFVLEGEYARSLSETVRGDCGYLPNT